jgi:hypothetical protein
MAEAVGSAAAESDDESPLVSRTIGGSDAQSSSQRKPALGCSFGAAAGATLVLAALVVAVVDLPVRTRPCCPALRWLSAPAGEFRVSPRLQCALN